VLEFQDGPTIIAGHFYGGQIMTALGDEAPNVVARLHRRFRARRGETLGALFSAARHARTRTHVHGLSRLRLALGRRLRQPFAADVDPIWARVMYAVQQALDCRPSRT